MAPRRAACALLFSVFLLTGCGGGSGFRGAGALPLLAEGTRVGIIYSQPEPGAQAVLDAAFAECIAAGVDTYELTTAWTDLETAPGVIDVSGVESLITTVAAAGLVPYLGIKTIDTNNLNLPADLTGLAFDDPLVLQRFGAIVDAVVPILVAHGGFFLSVGNEIDIYLAAHPGEVDAFAAFLAAARRRAHGIEPELAVGATLTYWAVGNAPAMLRTILDASDNIALTYYPLNPDSTVQDPAVVPGDFMAMVAAVAPKPVILQEVGYPSGYLPVPGNGSSPEWQRRFVEEVFAAIAAHPEIRYCSFLQLADWGDAELDLFEAYYGISDPLWREYLGSLGLRENDGTAKPAYAEFVAGVAQLRAP